MGSVRPHDGGSADVKHRDIVDAVGTLLVFAGVGFLVLFGLPLVAGIAP